MVSPLPISTSKSKLETSLLKNSITSLVSKTFSSSEERRKPIIFCFSSELTPSLDTAIRAHTATVPCINFLFLKRPTWRVSSSRPELMAPFTLSKKLIPVSFVAVLFRTGAPAKSPAKCPVHFVLAFEVLVNSLDFNCAVFVYESGNGAQCATVSPSVRRVSMGG
ncbi:Uncharacterised protein [Enterobacter cloacae]|uniref:Uncharacterized protein n=1 Tax=Enterobacter cloacae TaxID=550 RepID=A0A377LMF9_ENTCL|nr:Uncharacterised protein [Enterobacter cloacae]